MPIFQLKQFGGAISDFENRGVAGAFKFGSALDIRKKVDSLSCNQALVQEGAGVITDLILFTVPASDGNAYEFGSSGKIYKRTSAGVHTLVYTDVNGQIRGAGEWKMANGKSYLFWATSMNLNCKEIPGLANWTDVNANVVVGANTFTYPKINLTSTTWHTMTIANGALMIANGEYLAMIGWDGSYTNQAVRLLPNMNAQTLIERNNFVITGASAASLGQTARLFSWNQSALNYINTKKIPAAAINGMIDSEVMLMQAGTNGGLFFSDFVTTMPVTSFPGGGQVDPDGVADSDGLSLWGVFGSSDPTKNGVYSYGRKRKNGVFALNLEYPITCDEIGSVKIVGPDTLISYRSGATYKVMKVDPTAKQVAVYESLDLVAPLKTSQQTNWEQIRVRTKDMPTGTSIGVKYKIDKTGSWITAMLEGETALFIAGTEAIFSVGSPGNIAEVQVTLTPSGNATPEVYEIDVVAT